MASIQPAVLSMLCLLILYTPDVYARRAKSASSPCSVCSAARTGRDDTPSRTAAYANRNV
jgi:hypothetical protein